MNTSNDATEYECKFYPVDKEEYRKKLKDLGAVLAIPERKMIRAIADSHVNVILPKMNYIRVRQEGNLVRLSYKTTADQNGNLADQKEIDVEVSDFDKTVKILEATGLKFNRLQETFENNPFTGMEKHELIYD